MKTNYIADLETKDELEREPFLIQNVTRRTTRDGRPYLLCTYRDRSGEANGIFWDLPDHIDAWVRSGLPVLVTGQVTYYRDAIQINTHDVQRWETPDMTQFLPSSPRRRADMEAELHTLIESLASPWQELVSAVLLCPEVYARFLDAPAARNMHHAYIGGLLEHTLSMARLSLDLADHYPYVNKDRLLAGTLMHDVGKAWEYDVSNDFSFTDDGKLVGHIIRAITMVEKAAATLDAFPEEELRHIVHLLASHHGTREWGSPVVPKTIEAILLHQLDLIDSRVQGFFDHLSRDNSDETWSARSSHMFNTELRRPAGFGEEDN